MILGSNTIPFRLLPVIFVSILLLLSSCEEPGAIEPNVYLEDSTEVIKEIEKVITIIDTVEVENRVEILRNNKPDSVLPYFSQNQTESDSLILFYSNPYTIFSIGYDFPSRLDTIMINDTNDRKIESSSIINQNETIVGSNLVIDFEVLINFSDRTQITIPSQIIVPNAVTTDMVTAKYEFDDLSDKFTHYSWELEYFTSPDTTDLTAQKTDTTIEEVDFDVLDMELNTETVSLLGNVLSSKSTARYEISITNRLISSIDTFTYYLNTRNQNTRVQLNTNNVSMLSGGTGREFVSLNSESVLNTSRFDNTPTDISNKIVVFTPSTNLLDGSPERISVEIWMRDEHYHDGKSNTLSPREKMLLHIGFDLVKTP
ncbi:MAG: hypothetical protein Kapaf2KO_11060 [Candidatus Kapaibacteriales bacterium]